MVSRPLASFRRSHHGTEEVKMRPSWRALLLACLLTGVTLPTRAADSFSFTTIDVPGANYSIAQGINDAGQIVGEFRDAAGKGHGFLRTSDGTFTTIDAPGATWTGDLRGINNAGQIVGSWEDAGGKDHGFLRTSDGTFTTIDVPGATRVDVNGINNAGQIVGNFFETGKEGQGFLRNSDGTLTTLSFFGPEGINDAGQIAGEIFDAGRRFHGFVRTVDGPPTTFDVPGAVATLAYGINDAREIVGIFYNASGVQRVGNSLALTGAHGFLRTSTGTFTTIDVPGATDTAAYGINGAGQIVGSFSPRGEQKQHGFVATPALTLSGNAQQPPKWDRESATPGVQLTLQETKREKINGVTQVSYKLELSGFPEDKTYQLWMEEDLKFSRMPHDFKVNELNGMNDQISRYVKGEPLRIIVTSSDQTVKAFAEVFPFPIEARDGPCHLWAEIIPHTPGTAFAFYGEGFDPGEKVTTISQSDGEVIRKIEEALGDGSLEVNIIAPAVTGKQSGTASFSVTGKSCAPTVTYQWGPPALEIQ